VAEAQCRYRAPARFDDEVIVKTWIAEANSRVVTFAYEVRLADSDTVLATGSTRHLFVNRQMERTRMPDKYRPLFGLDEQGGRH
jgi:acyl-CoA thioester hydrolase